MAKAKRIGRVRLELTDTEAQVLAEVLSIIGGDPEKSHRKEINLISKALEDAGIRYRYGWGAFESRPGLVAFKDTESLYFEEE